MRRRKQPARKKKATHAIIDFTIKTRLPMKDLPTIKDPGKWIEYVNDRHLPGEEELISVNIRVNGRDVFEIRDATTQPCEREYD